MSIHHIAIISSSEESIEFYKRLGFDEFFRKKRSYDTVVLMRGHGIQLEIFVDPNHPGRATDPENLGLRHIAIRVDDIEKACAEYQCDSIMTDWVGERYCMTKDPDGLPIEFHE